MKKVYSGDARIDGLLSNSNSASSPILSWQKANQLGTPVELDYSFLSSGTNGVSGFSSMNNNLRSAVDTALIHFENVANITFNQVGAGNGDINFGTANFGGNPQGFTSGVAYTSWNINGTHSNYNNANIYLTNASFAGYSEADLGSSAYATLLHEVGHGMGLDHSFSGQTVPNGTDSSKYTVMSYTDFYPNGVNPTTLMLYDTMAIQYLYGANTDYKPGNTIINLKSYMQDGPAVLWDGGGTDTVSLTGLNDGITLNLNEGVYNTVNNVDDFVIAYDAEIENATGGSGDDNLIGNNLNNTLKGAKGADMLSGGGANDRLVGAQGKDNLKGGQGEDNIKGGQGNDRLSGGAGSDNFIFNGNAKKGKDTITDFEDGLDMIRIRGNLSLNDLSIDAIGGSTQASWGDNMIVLSGINGVIDADDFNFV